MDMPGDPMFLHSIVVFWQPGQRGPQLQVQQQQQVINYICRRTVLMDTEAAAKQYKSAMKQACRNCPDIISRDKGSVVKSGGSFSIGPGASAPAHINDLDVCLGAPGLEITPEYVCYHAVLHSLAKMAQLRQEEAEAQVTTNIECHKASCLLSVLFVQQGSRGRLRLLGLLDQLALDQCSITI